MCNINELCKKNFFPFTETVAVFPVIPGEKSPREKSVEEKVAFDNKSDDLFPPPSSSSSPDSGSSLSIYVSHCNP